LPGLPGGHRPWGEHLHGRHAGGYAQDLPGRGAVLHHRRGRAEPDHHLAGLGIHVRPGKLRRGDPAWLRALDAGLPAGPGSRSRAAEPGGDPRDGDLLHGLPGARDERPTGVVPRPRRGGAVHRQAPHVRGLGAIQQPKAPRAARRAGNRRSPRGCPAIMGPEHTSLERFRLTAQPESIALAGLAAQAADEKKGEDILVIDVSNRLAIIDCFVIVTGDNERHVQSIVDEVEDHLAENGTKPLRREGRGEGLWVLLDYGDVVVHVQRRAEREYYALDRLFLDAPQIEVEGVEQVDRGANWDPDAEVDVLDVQTIDDLPLAGPEPDADEL